MENKNLILVVSIVVVVFLAGSIILLQKQKMAGMQEKSDRLILNDAKIAITENGENGETTNYLYADGTMPLDCCTESDALRVRLAGIVSGGEARACMFTHPRGSDKSGDTITINFTGIKLKKVLRFGSGINDVMVGTGVPVYMDVYINDSFVQKITQTDTKGWTTTDVDTTKYQNKSADIKLVVYAESDNISQRHFCWDAITSD